MGLRSSDERGADCYDTAQERMEEIKRLRTTVRDLFWHMNQGALSQWTQDEFKKRPEVKRALDNVYEGSVT